MANLTTDEVRYTYVGSKFDLDRERSEGFRAFDEWLNEIKADVWDERGRTLASYLGPDNGHEWDWDCYCATYPNPYRKDANG